MDSKIHIPHYSTLIFTLSAADVHWALKHKKKYPQNPITILAPTAEAQLTLKHHHEAYFMYYSLLPRRAYLMGPSFYRQCQKYISGIQKQLKKYTINVCSLPTAKIMYYSIFYESSHVIYVSEIYKNIQKLQPTQIFFPYQLSLQPLSWTNAVSGSFALLQQMFPQEKITYFATPPIEKNMPFAIRSKLIVQKIPKYLLYLQKKILRKPIDVASQAQIVFHSGGQILRYYYRFFSLLKNASIPFAAVTYQQRLEDKLALIDKQLPEFHLKQNTAYAKKELRVLLSQLSKLSKKQNTLQTLIYLKLIVWLNHKGLSLIEEITKANFLFKQNNIKLFISTHDPSPPALAYVLTAEKNNVKTLTLQHGSPLNPFEMNFFSDHVATWGNLSNRFLLKYKFKKSKQLSIVGFPQIDQLPSIPKKAKASKQDIYNVGLLLTIYLPYDEIATQFLHELFAQLTNIKHQLRLHIRTHTGQNTKGIELLAQEYGIEAMLNEAISLDVFTQKNDLVICWDTTAIIWPLLYQKPLIHTSPLWGSGALPLKKYKAAFIPKNAADCVDYIKKVMNDPDILKQFNAGRRDFIRDYIGRIDGNASNRLFKVVEKLLGSL